MTALQAIILDFDGVIADSEPLHYEAFRLTLAEEGLDLARDAYYERYLGFDDFGFFQALARDLRLQVNATSWAADLVTRKGVKLQELLDAGSVLFPGVTRFVGEAAERVPLAIASGARLHEIKQIVDVAGLARHFVTLVAADHTPESKPSPAPYRLALKQLRQMTGRDLSAERTVAVEDSHWGLESARGAGLRVVAVTTSYDAKDLPGAELVVPGLNELSLDDLDRLCAAPPEVTI